MCNTFQNPLPNSKIPVTLAGSSCKLVCTDESWLLACRLAVRVEDASGLCAGESELSLTVSREVQLESVTLAFSEGEIQDAINETLPYPQALATQSATLDPTQTLKVS